MKWKKRIHSPAVFIERDMMMMLIKAERRTSALSDEVLAFAILLKKQKRDE